MQIDLRSDTLTHPSPEMREAMYRAEVGDDVYGEDPTVNRLQELAAEMVGKEAALFVPTGTMGNAAAILAHAGRGQAVIAGDKSHIYLFEGGGAALLGGSPITVVPNLENGMLDLTRLQASIRDESDVHEAPTALVCIENTQNLCGGTVLNEAQIAEIATITHTHNLKLHMDGARLFNAATALGVPVSTVTRNVDSVMFCLSKGLSAPVGSLLAGNKEFIQRANRIRKFLGGGMRQVGIIAAAGIVALEQMVDRLAEDHENLQLLAQGLAEVPQIDIHAEHMVTNILVFHVRNAQGQLGSEADAARFIAQVREHGVLLSGMGEGRIRAVTHYGIEHKQIETALKSIRQAAQKFTF
jgi:threonine aldolase